MAWPTTGLQNSSSQEQSQFSFEGAIKNGGEQGIQLGGGLGLQALQRAHLRLQRVLRGHDPACSDD